MDLKSLLEENSVESISKKTNISVDNLKKLFEHDFSGLKKVQTFGFISILERDYGLNLSALRQECKEYFVDNDENFKISFAEAPKGNKGKWFFAVMLLFILATIIFFMIYDNNMMRNTSKQNPQPLLTQEMVLDDANASENISEDMVANGTISKDEIEEIQDESLVFENNSSEEISDANKIEAQDANGSTTMISRIAIMPKYKLWFGIYDMTNGKILDQTIKAPFELPLDHDLLIATSRAAFSIGIDENITGYKDFKEHYFMLKGGKFSEIERAQFLELNGPKKW